jgi:hypothetical protein
MFKPFDQDPGEIVWQRDGSLQNQETAG